jgi:hypothetical protein
MPEETHFKDQDGNWQQVEEIYLKKQNIWLSAKEAYRKIFGEWKRVFQSTDPFDPSASLTRATGPRTGKSGSKYRFKVSVESGEFEEAERVGYVRFQMRKRRTDRSVPGSYSDWKGEAVDESGPYLWDKTLINEGGSNARRKYDYQIRAQVVASDDPDLVYTTNVVTVTIDDTNNAPEADLEVQGGPVPVGASYNITATAEDDYGLESMTIERKHKSDSSWHTIGGDEIALSGKSASKSFNPTAGRPGVFQHRVTVEDVDGEKDTYGPYPNTEITAEDSSGPSLENSGAASEWVFEEGETKTRRFTFVDDQSVPDVSMEIKNDGSTGFKNLYSARIASNQAVSPENKRTLDIEVQVGEYSSGGFPRNDVKLQLTATDSAGNEFTLDVSIKVVSGNTPPRFANIGSGDTLSLTEVFGGYYRYAKINVEDAETAVADFSVLRITARGASPNSPSENETVLPTGIDSVSHTSLNLFPDEDEVVRGADLAIRIDNTAEVGSYDLDLVASDGEDTTRIPITFVVEEGNRRPYMKGLVDGNGDILSNASFSGNEDEVTVQFQAERVYECERRESGGYAVEVPVLQGIEVPAMRIRAAAEDRDGNSEIERFEVRNTEYSGGTSTSLGSIGFVESTAGIGDYKCHVAYKDAETTGAILTPFSYEVRAVDKKGAVSDWMKINVEYNLTGSRDDANCSQLIDPIEDPSTLR